MNCKISFVSCLLTIRCLVLWMKVPQSLTVLLEISSNWKYLQPVYPIKTCFFYAGIIHFINTRKTALSIASENRQISSLFALYFGKLNIRSKRSIPFSKYAPSCLRGCNSLESWYKDRVWSWNLDRRCTSTNK